MGQLLSDSCVSIAGTRMNPGLALAVLLGAMVGCGEAPDEGVETESQTPAHVERLVAQINLPDEGKLEFFETAPGMIVINETGTLGNVRIPNPREDDMNAVELYESISGAPAPRALVDAVGRIKAPEAVETAYQAPVVVVPVAAKPSINKLQRSESRDWFLLNFCIDEHRNHLWTWVTGSGSVKTTGTNWFRSAAAPVFGDITWRANAWDCGVFPCFSNANPGLKQSTTVSPGWFARIYVECRNCTVEAKVSDADGDTYDFCTRWYY